MDSTIISLEMRGNRADELLSHLDERLAEEYGHGYLGIRSGAGPQLVSVHFRPGRDRSATERRVRALLSETSAAWDEHVALA